MAVAALSVTTLRADDTNAAAGHACCCSGHAPAALPAPSLEQRVAGLEAYIGNNSNPNATLLDTNGNQVVASTPVMGVAGPGHNAWMMTSTALVLFMTLPGLALFYGGMVRKEERPLRAGPMLPHHRPCNYPVVDVRVQHGFWTGQSILRQTWHLCIL